MKTQIQHLALAFIIFIGASLVQSNAQHSEFYGYGLNNIFRTDSNGNNLQIVYNFPSSFEGANPSSSLCKASNGKFYGITMTGGLNGDGVLFEWDPITNFYKKKLDLNRVESGRGQFCSLMQAANGKFYGMTSMGGINNCGVLFEWDLVTNTIIKKVDFNGTKNGSSPEGSLIQADNGRLYGMTTSGGTGNCGVLFEWDPTSDTYTKKLDFNGIETGCGRKSSLCRGDNGKFYSLTTDGGLNDNGVLFEWDPATNAYIKKFDFNPENGEPTGSLIRANNGKFYGGTRSSIFEWDPATNTLTKMIGFIGHDGCWPGMPESFVQADNGKLYGILRRGNDCQLSNKLFEWVITEDTLKIVHSFGQTDPIGSLSSAGNGKLYGVTRLGGDRGCGIIYELDTERNIYTKKIDFNKADNGLAPIGVPVKADNGKLYGVTQLGGDYNDGVLFEWDPVANIFTKKFSFNGKGSGKEPSGSLVKSDNGKLYGMTNSGGLYDCGVLFEWDLSNNCFLKKLDLINKSTWCNSLGRLMRADNGKLYGTLYEGGLLGRGVLFEWNPLKDQYKRIIDFDGAEFGSQPGASLVQANNGKLYGTTRSGGSNNMGVLFELDPVTNTFVKKLDFDGVQNGGQSFSSMIQADNGKLYGTSCSGGLYGYGVLFEWDPVTDTYSNKIEFNGAYPRGDLMQAINGKIYGIISLGQWNDLGSLFEWDPVTGIFIRKPGNTDEGLLIKGGLTEVSCPVSDTINVGACNSYISPSGKYIWDASGVYKDTIPGAKGNASIITINLTIKNSTSGEINPTVYHRYISPNGKIWTNSGEYKDTIPNAVGCDSIITFHLTIIPSDTTSAQEFYGLTLAGGEFNSGTIYKTDAEGNNLAVVYSFPVINEGISPTGSLCATTNGRYYGVTKSGGRNGCGVIYEWDPVNDAFTIKYAFGNDSNGKEPCGSLILADNGKLYGMTRYGGSHGSGVLFEWDPQTDTYNKKLDFTVFSGRNPEGSLVQATNGKLYGMTYYGGLYGEGVIFEWDPATNTFTDKFDFGECFCTDAGKVTGGHPVGAMIQTINGKLYGMTSAGGEYERGVLFEWDPNSDIYSKKFDFNDENGSHPAGSLILASNGMLYGVTENGGVSGSGILFAWDPSTNTFSKKLDFSQNENGYYPSGSLILADNGEIYGLHTRGGVNGYGTLFKWNLTTNIYKKEFDFNGLDKGASPVSLTLANNNRLLGITSEGGITNSGVLFEWDMVKESFTKKIEFNSCENGSRPMGKLVQVGNNKLYGTTYSGGEFDRGVLFEWDISTHIFTKKADFTGKETGSHPIRSMVLADNGKLIGITFFCSDGPPSIFEWDPFNSVLTKTYTFSSDENGSLVKAKNGKIYGTAYNGAIRRGEIFEWDPFRNAYIKKIEGGFSNFSLTQANNGKFYGIGGGGTPGVSGIFEWDPNTNTYCIKCDYIPAANSLVLCSPLMQADNGKFYGRLSADIEKDEGCIYEWNTTINMAAIRIGNTDLYNPQESDSPMLQASNGKIYGTSSRGGKYGKGTLFEYDPVSNIFVSKNHFNTFNGSMPSGELIELKHSTSGVLYVQALCSYTSPSGKYTWTKTGAYKDTVPSFAGLDSNITVNLTVLSPDNSIIQNQGVLTANASGATYQWVNCKDDKNPIEGATQQNFAPTASGEYAVIVKQNGCTDTSDCVAVNVTELIFNTFKNNITLYPNPNNGLFSIDLVNFYSHVDVTITTFEGRIIQISNYDNVKIINLKLDAEPGIYLVTITTINDRKVVKIMKK